MWMQKWSDMKTECWRKITCWEVACENLSGVDKLCSLLVLANPLEKINSGQQEHVQGYQYVLMWCDDDTYSYHIVDGSGCCIQPNKAGTRRDLLSTHLKPTEPQQGPPFLSKPPERASQWLLQLGSKEWSWTWVLHECLHVPLSAINNNSLMLLVVTVKSINATLIDAGCDVCRPLMKEVFKQIIIWKWCFGEKKQFPSSGVWTGEYSLKV